MFILMPVIFVLGILAIALEDKIKINKAAIALFMAISMWMRWPACPRMSNLLILYRTVRLFII